MSRFINFKKVREKKQKKNGTDRTNGYTSLIDIISNIISIYNIRGFFVYRRKILTILNKLNRISRRVFFICSTRLDCRSVIILYTFFFFSTYSVSTCSLKKK